MIARRRSCLSAAWILLLCLAASAANLQAGLGEAAVWGAADGGSHARSLKQNRPPCVGPACGPPGAAVGPGAAQPAANTGPAGQPAAAAAATGPPATTAAPSAPAAAGAGSAAAGAAAATIVPVPELNSTDGAHADRCRATAVRQP